MLGQQKCVHNLSLSHKDARKLLDSWVEATMKEHPLPNGAKWLMCTEDSRHFVGTTDMGLEP
jgi:hypothetical protein